MKLPRQIHRWNVTPAQAVAIQRRLASRVRCEGDGKPIRYVAGLDAAFPRGRERCVAAVVLWDMEAREVLESHVAHAPLRLPYIPGLLSFREAPALLAVLRKLSRVPDALMCDGQGLAHPRRMGIATHMGLVTDLASMGCAKSVLTGEPGWPKEKRGSRASLMDGNERIGTVLRTRDGVKPVFVSIGHKIDLSTATRVVLRCTGAYRLPEPTRLADKLVGEEARRQVLR